MENSDENTSNDTEDAKRAPDVLAFQNTLRKMWSKITSQEFQGAAMVFSTIAIAFFTASTWYVIYSGSGDTSRAATAASNFATTAGSIETDLKKAVDDNKRALADNNQAIKDTLAENRTELAKALDQNRKSMEDSTVQSKAALDASIASSQLDQRPWVVPSSFQLSAEPETGKETTVTIGLQNTGKTPALNVHFQSRVASWPVEPATPDFDSITAIVSQGLISPGIAGFSFTTDPMTLTFPQASAYEAKQTKMYIQARVEYTDTLAGNKMHWTTLCIFHVSGTPLASWSFCSDGNDVDH